MGILDHLFNHRQKQDTLADFTNNLSKRIDEPFFSDSPRFKSENEIHKNMQVESRYVCGYAVFMIVVFGLAMCISQYRWNMEQDPMGFLYGIMYMKMKNTTDNVTIFDSTMNITNIIHSIDSLQTETEVLITTTTGGGSQSPEFDTISDVVSSYLGITTSYEEVIEVQEETQSILSSAASSVIELVSYSKSAAVEYTELLTMCITDAMNNIIDSTIDGNYPPSTQETQPELTLQQQQEIQHESHYVITTGFIPSATTTTGHIEPIPKSIVEKMNERDKKNRNNTLSNINNVTKSKSKVQSITIDADARRNRTLSTTGVSTTGSQPIIITDKKKEYLEKKKKLDEYRSKSLLTRESIQSNIASSSTSSIALSSEPNSFESTTVSDVQIFIESRKSPRKDKIEEEVEEEVEEEAKIETYPEIQEAPAQTAMTHEEVSHKSNVHSKESTKNSEVHHKNNKAVVEREEGEVVEGEEDETSDLLTGIDSTENATLLLIIYIGSIILCVIFTVIVFYIYVKKRNGKRNVEVNNKFSYINKAAYQRVNNQTDIGLVDPRTRNRQAMNTQRPGTPITMNGYRSSESIPISTRNGVTLNNNNTIKGNSKQMNHQN